MTSFAYPASLKPNSWSYDLLGMSMSGGRTLAGTEQRVYNNAGYWRITYDIPIRNREQALAWRTMATRLRAGEQVVAKVFDMWRANGALGTGQEARLSASAALRATTLSVSTVNLALEPGVAFSIGERLHRIVDITASDPAESIPDWFTTGSLWDDGGLWVDAPMTGSAEWTVKILPPLRAAAASGALLDFENLQCVCVIDDPQNGDLKLDLGRFADVTLTLIEYI